MTQDTRSEEQKLVEFFRDDPHGRDFGRQGDYYDMSPAETAISVMRQTFMHASKCKRFRDRLHWSGTL